MGTEIVRHEQRALAPLSHFDTPSNVQELQVIAGFMVKSGFFKDVKDVAQAMMKIIAGAELGLGPVQSQKVIYFVDGTPSFSSNFIAAQIKRSLQYDYKIVEATDNRCELEFFERDHKDNLASVGKSSFTIEEARKANLAGKWNWKTYTSDMLFSRALTRGARRYCPDAFGVLPVYTPEEISSGEVIDLEFIEVHPQEETPTIATPAPEVLAPVDGGHEEFVETMAQEGVEVVVTSEPIIEDKSVDEVLYSRPWMDESKPLQDARNELYAVAVTEWNYPDVDDVRNAILGAKDSDDELMWGNKPNPIPDHKTLNDIALYLEKKYLETQPKLT